MDNLINTKTWKGNCTECGIEMDIVAIKILNDDKVVKEVCDGCIDKARAEEAERDAIEKKREQLQMVSDKILNSCGNKYRATAFVGYDAASDSQKKALVVAREFSRNPEGFLYMYGQPGVGKTHLAVSVFRAILMQGMSAQFWSTPELLLHLRSELRNSSEEESIRPMVSTRVLILDDIGAEKMTDWVRQAFYIIISQREKNEMPTVFTSNLSLGEIEDKVGDNRLTSRIAGAARIMNIEGLDYRIANRKERVV